MRTYRYVRLALLASVVFLSVAVAQQIVAGVPLRSISALYYTPGRSVFVGALFAVSLALVVLAGKSRRRFLLLLAGMTTPVIALVPPPLPSGELRALTGSGCPSGMDRCPPPEATDAAAVGVLSYLVVAALVLTASIVLAAAERRLDRALAVRTVLAIALLVALGAWSPYPSFDYLGHYAAAALFFFFIAAAAGVHSAALPEEGTRGPGSARFHSISNGVLSVLISGVDVALVLLVLSGTAERVLGPQWLLIGEAAGLGLFAAFWVLQTVENWNESNAAAR
ncbi:hypothetical protein GSU68_12595 [Rathayibacter sp. VKM Ac-2759]|uniref:hypothetical protein n=1 Tax=Rathayibacter sp. VKM Ac-2759 TaxID=2609252 RepID=UPI001316E6A3|nr:hypothetical protein [Rathayibacter sp. VKM Ac-2759]QHC67319.1 hypothetical protein GSU68_12595 [Rathayibacter sp. VKM Ac-2759]